MAIGIGAMCTRLEAMEHKWRDGMHIAISDAVDMAVERAREVVPVDTGALRASIDGRISGLQGAVTAGAPYALYVEIGTGRGAPAQPYLRPAFDRAAAELLRRAGEVMLT